METPRKLMALGPMDSHTPSDMFSTLPDSIIFRIFSFLDPNLTVRLSSVSKKFKRFCRDTPYLYLSADFDSTRNSSARYIQFCNYVDSLMKSRVRLKIDTDRFLFHWFCKQARLNIGAEVLSSCLKLATMNSVRELDIFVSLGWRNTKYSLPHSVYEFQFLSVLRLNLQMAELILEHRNMNLVEVFLLDSACIDDLYFGKKISFNWSRLRRLHLHKVHCMKKIDMEISSLEELKLSNCETRSTVFSDWSMNIASSSLKNLSISRCSFRGPCRINLDCPSLVNFSDFGSDFDRLSTLKIASQCLDYLGICNSNFEKFCYVWISCPSVKHIEINGSKFKQFCLLRMNSLSLDLLTVSDCELIYPDERITLSSNKRKINVLAESLRTLTINSSDKYFYKTPISISAPSLQAIIWKGNPVNFSYLKNLNSLEHGIIDIQPSCQHKSKQLSCHCKLFMSSIYCVAMLLQSLKDAKILEISFWPIELFFMKNDEPIIFKNLLDFVLLVNDLKVEQLPVIASFLKGLPNLVTLVIKCEKKSALLDDPDLIDLLGLCSKAFTVSLSQDSKQLKIVRGNAHNVEED